MPRATKNQRKAVDRLVKLGLLETCKEGGKTLYRPSEQGLQEYATMLVGICTLGLYGKEAEEINYLESKRSQMILGIGITEARNVAAKVQRAVQSKDHSDPMLETAKDAAVLTVARTNKKKMRKDEMSELAGTYFSFLAPVITPETMEYLCTGERPTTSGG